MSVKLQRNAQDASFLETTFDAIRMKDAETDAEKVQELLDEWQSGGLGVAGPEATLRAFELGQVDELIITGSVESLKPVQKLPDAAPAEMQADTSAPETGIDEARLKLSAELIKRRAADRGSHPLHRGRHPARAASAALARCFGSESEVIMSSQNKVNPGMYTQRGRLTQDDAAREIARAARSRIAAHVAARATRQDAAA